jgi:phosphate transport system substrate-binding protein
MITTRQLLTALAVFTSGLHGCNTTPNDAGRQASAQAIAGQGQVQLARLATAKRRHIDIVGSSTVYPFSTVVAERFGKTTAFRTPKVEATGSGGGLKLFCDGVGPKFPDVANSSRRIKASEVARCEANGVTEIVEMKIGYDGIVLANSKKTERFSLTLRELWLALAKHVPAPGAEGQTIENPNRNWSDINPKLPSRRIEVLGPPPTSGTRDAFVELALEGGCTRFEWVAKLKEQDEGAYKLLCHTVREDGAFIEAGENDNLIVQKLEANPSGLGIFGFSFLEQNADKVHAATVDGVAPNFETIGNGRYPVARPLYSYVKKAHVGMVPGIEEYLAELSSDKAWGPDGYLQDKGMIPMPEAERAKFARAA